MVIAVRHILKSVLFCIIIVPVVHLGCPENRQSTTTNPFDKTIDMGTLSTNPVNQAARHAYFQEFNLVDLTFNRPVTYGEWGDSYYRAGYNSYDHLVGAEGYDAGKPAENLKVYYDNPGHRVYSVYTSQKAIADVRLPVLFCKEERLYNASSAVDISRWYNCDDRLALYSKHHYDGTTGLLASIEYFLPDKMPYSRRRLAYQKAQTVDGTTDILILDETYINDKRNGYQFYRDIASRTEIEDTYKEGIKIQSAISYFNEQGFKVKQEYITNGKLTYYWIYTYNQNHVLINKEKFDPSGKKLQ